MPVVVQASAASGPIPVVLVGRTNLEGVLRLDSTFEVYRAADGPAALGQVSRLGNGGGGCPLVVVSDESDAASRSDAFRAAVGKVSVNARVVRLHGREAEEAVKSASDVSMRESPAAIREALRRMASGGDPESGEATAEAVVERVMAGGNEQRTRPTEPVDTPMLRAMLAGRDPVLAGLEVIRRSVGTGDVFFVSSRETGGERAVESKRRVSVEYHGRVYGELVSGSAGIEAMGPWGEWLAHWLALREQQEQLRHAAMVDELTGAWNRRYFDGFLSAAMKHAGEHGHSVTVLYFDIDNFKQYNDQYGHGAGDEILKETVRLLQSVIRPTDRVCRIGGDEFGVVFHEPEGPREAGSVPPTQASIREIAERFQRQICEHRFPKLGELAPGMLTISGGLASYPHDAGTAAELVSRADELAMESKRQGKNVIKIGPGAARVCGGH